MLMTYLALDHMNFDSSFPELTECLTRVQKWLDGEKLKLNPQKTEFIITGDKHAKVPHAKISDPASWKF